MKDSLLDLLIETVIFSYLNQLTLSIWTMMSSATSQVLGNYQVDTSEIQSFKVIILFQ